VPSRKQRRRREKTFRHEYDLVVYDEEGNEVPVDTGERRAVKEKDAAKAKKGQQRGSKSARPAREVPPPSWERAVKRGGLMGIVLIVVMTTLVHGPLSLGIVYGVVLIPFTYWVDRLAYRKYLSRTGKS
jgi:hypothetical protein